MFGIAAEPHYLTKNLNNRIVNILGSHPRNFESTLTVLQRLDSIRPSIICLTEFHPDSYRDYKFFNTVKNFTKGNFPYSDQDLLIKSEFSKYFNRDYLNNLFFYHEDSGCFYLSDYENKRLIPDDNLSVAHWSYLDRDCGLVGASPHPFMVHEDLCHNLPLDQLKHIFHHSLKEYTRKAKGLGLEPLTQPMDLYYFLHTLSKHFFPEELISKRNSYTASIVQKVTQSFKKAVVIHDHNQCKLLENQLGVTNPPYESIYTTQEYNGSIEEVMEKIVILSHLDNKIVRFWIEAGVNPFDHLFAGQFKYPIKEIQQGFEYFNSYYRDVLTKTLIQDIERIAIRSDRGRRTIPIIETAKKIEMREGNFLIGRNQELLRSRIACEIIFRKILKNIEKKRMAGDPQRQELQALGQLGKCQYTQLNIEILKKLIAEANSQVNVFKLPKEFRKYQDQLHTKVSVEQFYTHFQSSPLPEFETYEEKILSSNDGNSVVMIGSGMLPPELKDKTAQDFAKIEADVVYETPMNYDGSSPFEELREVRGKLKYVSDNMGKLDD